MTDREREFAAIGFGYAEGIDNASVVIVPSTGREIRKTARGTWECQPWNDNYWLEFDDLLNAAKFATQPKGSRMLKIHTTVATEQTISVDGVPKGTFDMDIDFHGIGKVFADALLKLNEGNESDGGFLILAEAIRLYYRGDRYGGVTELEQLLVDAAVALVEDEEAERVADGFSARTDEAEAVDDPEPDPEPMDHSPMFDDPDDD